MSGARLRLDVRSTDKCSGPIPEISTHCLILGIWSMDKSGWSGHTTNLKQALMSS